MPLNMPNSVLGMNRRNALIARFNGPRAILRVNDKFLTKTLLAEAGVPVPPTLALIESRTAMARFDYDALPASWAMKPNRGRRGEGVLLAVEKVEGGWRSTGGKLLTPGQVRTHVSHILDGEISLEGTQEDSALIEPLIRAHEEMARLIPFGLPDIRVICLANTPLMAMVRLPTVQSEGRSNLHQGAIGAAIDLANGRIFRAVQDGVEMERHPSTDAQLIGVQIPFWDEVLEAASRCCAPLGLGYAGVDVVIDEKDGVQVLECNAYPGLEIQNVNARGLREPMEMAMAEAREPRRRWFWQTKPDRVEPVPA